MDQPFDIRPSLENIEVNRRFSGWLAPVRGKEDFAFEVQDDDVVKSELAFRHLSRRNQDDFPVSSTGEVAAVRSDESDLAQPDGGLGQFRDTFFVACLQFVHKGPFLISFSSAVKRRSLLFSQGYQ